MKIMLPLLYNQTSKYKSTIDPNTYNLSEFHKKFQFSSPSCCREIQGDAKSSLGMGYSENPGI